MDEAVWRMSVSFNEKAEAAALAERVEVAGKLGDDATVSFSGGKRLFVYAPTSEALRRGAATLRAAAEAVGVVPAQVTAGQWLPDETRWSDESRRPDDRTAGVITGILGEFFDRV
jgi:hypothetical protein